jgi:dihydrodiol dehydrogenase / D-xylose 1-dehydrogenase (NADP)
VADTIRWGIMGTGNIAHRFAEGLSALPDAEIIAVGSRTEDRADAFGEEFGVPHRHGSYEALANDPEVAVIYIATPHAMHREDCLLCLGAGKAVLCEKPLTINAREAEEVIRVARGERRFLMEAMWTRFIPAMSRVREWLATGAVGEVRMVQASFGFRAEPPGVGRLFDLSLGGGALLDVGVYPVSFASMVFGGPPERITSFAQMGESGVDEQAAMVLGYAGGALALLSCAIRTQTPHEAHILGTEGRIRVHAPFWCPTAVTLSVSGRDDFPVELPLQGNGYNWEAAEVMACLRGGRTESSLMPLDESLAIMQTMDAIRAQWGLVYPMESAR